MRKVLTRVLTLWPLGLAVCTLAPGAVGARELERPLIPLLSAEQIVPFCDRGLGVLRNKISAIEHLPPARAADAQKVLNEWNQLQMLLEDLQGPADIQSNVSPDPLVRSRLEACLIEANKLATALYQNPKLYARIQAVRPGDAIERKLRLDIMHAFEDTGATLPPAKRARMKAILERMEQLSQDFARNIRDNNQKLSFTPDEVRGLPADYLARAKRDDQGNYLLGLGTPEYVPFMENADRSDARRRYKIAFDNKGTEKNPPLLQEAMALRLEIAHLFDLPSYADFATRRRMAENPATVEKFLAEVRQAVTEQEKKELEELRAFRAESEHTALAETRLMRWDVGYWQEKLKRSRYDIDENALRKYFPTEAVVPWVLQVSSQLYGVQFRPVKVPVWHADVVYYDVIDSRSHQRIGGIYLDMYPREGKYNHAAAWPVRGVSTLARRTPISVLVTNFDRVGLTSDELRTLVHEFGHVLHGVLSHTRYVLNAGTSVERDFVEAPSQMYQEWSERKEPLALLPQFCRNGCPAIDDAMLKRMTAARNLGRGIQYARQLLYAGFDMRLHTAQGGDPLLIWRQMEGETPLGSIPGSEFPGQFGHLMGGYAAGYYGYMWSQVLALDMLSQYKGKLMDTVVGMRYRQAILARGSELRGQDLVRGFLGRAPDSRAFYDEIAGKRQD